MFINYLYCKDTDFFVTLHHNLRKNKHENGYWRKIKRFRRFALAFQETMLFNRLFFDVGIWHVRKPHNGTFTV